MGTWHLSFCLQWRLCVYVPMCAAFRRDSFMPQWTFMLILDVTSSIWLTALSLDTTLLLFYHYERPAIGALYCSSECSSMSGYGPRCSVFFTRHPSVCHLHDPSNLNPTFVCQMLSALQSTGHSGVCLL
ncbi:hypothetical protein BD769DRAFT_1492815 [Suillus cothurnatus]|nr:hypothetical protein BD769DRAFT_1492815 [Suillus cothurnatus]